MPDPDRPQNSLSLRGVRKAFGAVAALGGVDFDLVAGEVHALLGENGAGKSTLLHIAFGLIPPDSGTLLIHGSATALDSPRAARDLGIGMVHQHFTSIGPLSVAENVALATGRRFAGWPEGPAARLAQGLDPEALVETLSVGLRQRLEIVKALAAGARILLLDEPTSVLAPAETRELLGFVREFAAAGGAVAFVTHKLNEVFGCADRVTVLRRGVVTLSAPLAGQSEATLAAAMIGDATVAPIQPNGAVQPAGLTPPAPGAEAGKRVGPGVAERGVAIELTGVTVPPLAGRGPGLRDASVVVRRGELVAIAGVEGNGQREFVLAVAGRVPVAAGRMAVAEPVSLVPEDRTTEGVIGALSLVENLTMTMGAHAPWVQNGWIDWGLAVEETRLLLEEFDVRAPGPVVPAAALSGGNQQKLVMAGALARRPAVLVAENPTRGLDLRATAAVTEALRNAAADGVAVLVYSSDLDEVLALGADRLLVVANGSLAELPPNTDRAQVGRAMLTGPVREDRA